MAKKVTITEFKANCAEILEELETGGEPITITKRGRPMAVINQVVKQPKKKRSQTNILGSWAGRAKIVGDIVNFSPWDALREK